MTPEGIHANNDTRALFLSYGRNEREFAARRQRRTAAFVRHPKSFPGRMLWLSENP
jgi:hypothetical protein